MKPTETPLSLESLVALCKRRGFVYPAADIYGGINGIYDIGHLGVLMKRNIRNIWISSLNNPLGPVVELEGSLLAPEAVWKASGHVAGFHDPMVGCLHLRLFAWLLVCCWLVGWLVGWSVVCTFVCLLGC